MTERTILDRDSVRRDEDFVGTPYVVRILLASRLASTPLPNNGTHQFEDVMIQ